MAQVEAIKSFIYKCPKCGMDGYLPVNNEHPEMIPSGKCNKCKAQHTSNSLLKHYRRKHKGTVIPLNEFNVVGMIYFCDKCYAQNSIEPILVIETTVTQYFSEEDVDLPRSKRSSNKRTIELFRYPESAKCRECHTKNDFSFV